MKQPHKQLQQLSSPVGPTFGPSGISVIDATHAEDWRMDWTIHPFQKVLLIVEGSGFIEDGSFAWPIKKGVLVYVPDNWRYRVTDNPGNPVSLFILFFQTDIFGTHREIGFEKRPVFFSRESFAQQALERMRQLFYEQSTDLPGSKEILRGMAWRFLGEIKRANPRSAPPKTSTNPHQSSESRVREFINELHDSFYRPVSLELIAQRLGMSKRCLTSHFRKATGTSVLNYMHQLRVEHAKKLLRESRRSVQTIAFECGFDNLSNFYRTFKNQVGCSPKKWKSRINSHAPPEG